MNPWDIISRFLRAERIPRDGTGAPKNKSINIVAMFLPRNGEDARRVGVIVSHKHKFIFIKTRKTAGTSIELFLSRFCGEKDIITPIYPVVPDADYHVPRNWRGLYNPLPDLSDALRAGEGTSRPYEVWKMTRRFLSFSPIVLLLHILLLHIS